MAADPQVITKAIKALLAVAMVLGIEISEGHAEAIVQGALAVVAVLYSAEAWWKRRADADQRTRTIDRAIDRTVDRLTGKEPDQ